MKRISQNLLAIDHLQHGILRSYRDSFQSEQAYPQIGIDRAHGFGDRNARDLTKVCIAQNGQIQLRALTVTFALYQPHDLLDALIVLFRIPFAIFGQITQPVT